MTTPRQSVGESRDPESALQIIASLRGKRSVDVERLFEAHLKHRHEMDVRAWRYRLISLVAGLGVFAFLAWFAVRLADQGNALEAVGLVGIGGVPIVALFVTGEVVSRRMLK